jgi:hypothetical protein
MSDNAQTTIDELFSSVAEADKGVKAAATATVKPAALELEKTPEPAQEKALSKKEEKDAAKVVMVPLARVEPHPDNPLQMRDDTEMASLAQSVAESGVLTPAIMHSKGNGLSYLPKKDQRTVFAAMQREMCTPSLAQALKMKQFLLEGNLTNEVIVSIMQEQKANQVKMGFACSHATPHRSAYRPSGEAQGISAGTILSHFDLTPQIADRAACWRRRAAGRQRRCAGRARAVWC